MRHRIFALGLVFTIIWAIPGLALDRSAIDSALDDLSKGVSQTAYTMSEREGSAERASFDAASVKAEKAQKELSKLISNIETAEDLGVALDAIKKFGAKDPLHAYSADIALKILKERANFLNLPDSGAGADIQKTIQEVKASNLTTNALRPNQLLSRAQRGLVMIQLPIAEAVISAQDNKKNNRIDAIKEIFRRHECKLIASAVDDSRDQDQTNFYISGKKFVIEALMRNFKGTEINSNFKAIMTLKTGGFLGSKEIEVVVSPDSSAKEKGSLAWYQAVLEKDPWKYLAETNYSKLSQLGKVETVAGEKKLRLKNATLYILIVGPNGTKADAIYKNKVEFGDVYVTAH